MRNKRAYQYIEDAYRNIIDFQMDVWDMAPFAKAYRPFNFPNDLPSGLNRYIYFIKLRFMNIYHLQHNNINIINYLKNFLNSMTKYLKNGEYTYQEKDFLGEGSFAKVYKGIITKSGRVIAVRLLPLSLIKKYGTKIKQIINGEVNVLLQLAYTQDPDRMFTTKIYDCFLTQNNVTMILEFCPDGNLQEIITKKGALSQQDALDIIYQLARGIQFISKKNVVHRDIKPDNIFIKKEQPYTLYKLGDFGFAVKKQINDQIVGTPIFMSPEIFKEEKYGSEVDVWAFGLMVHYMLFKQFYFIANSQPKIKQRVLKERYELKNHHLGKISSKMADFLRQCLQFQKKDRIKAQQISKHPVFNSIRDRTQKMMKEITQKQIKTQSIYNQANPKVRILNKLSVYNFIYDLAMALIKFNPFNLGSLYLIKHNLGQLHQVRTALQENKNYYQIENWDEFLKSADFGKVKTFLQHNYTLNVSTFQNLFNDIMTKVNQVYGNQAVQGIKNNLGDGPYSPIKPEVIIYELTNNNLNELRKSNTPENYTATLQIFVVKAILQKKPLKFDFCNLQMTKKSLSLLARTQLIQKALKQSK